MNNETELPADIEGWRIDWKSFWMPNREVEPPYFYCYDRLIEIDDLGFLFHSLSERSNNAYFGHLVVLRNKANPSVFADYKELLVFTSIEYPIKKCGKHIAVHSGRLRYLIINIEAGILAEIQNSNSYAEPIELSDVGIRFGTNYENTEKYEEMTWIAVDKFAYGT